MLTIVCPKCQHEMTLTKFKAGKFSPTCKSCNTKFQLLIVQKDDQTFVSKTGLISTQPNSTQSAKPAPAKPIAKVPADAPANPIAKAFGIPAKPAGKKPDPMDATSAFDQSKTSLDETNVPPKAASKVPAKTPTKAKLDETSESLVSGKSPAALDSTQASSVFPQKTNTQKGATQKGATQHSFQTVAGGATRTEASKGPRSATKKEPAIGGNLGPYRLLKLLGQGGMGSVYLAKQTSLDRNVALKVIKTNLSDRPSMLARFTREAYAAAQLVHPNVVQIYDMGDDHGNCFFSMELVKGQSLSEVVVNDQKVDPQQAASYILHAARGLECAHNAGMVHRDIKPANLMVDETGMVKVADLGLVKVSDQDEIEDKDSIDEMSALSASKDLTRFGTAIGTPYYMAPEQATNAVTVDHRADIYSLGCTFYVLLTGKKPFDGSSFQEVVSKHSTAPLVMPSKLVARVPDSLSAIVAKMMAKNPADRYQTMRQLIVELEKFLGISSTAGFTPEEQDAVQLEHNANAFNGVGLAKVRGLLPLALIAACCLIAILLLFFNWRWATGFLILPLSAMIGYFVFGGARENSNLFSKTRELIFRSGFISWLKWLAASLLLLVASFLVGLFIPWLILGLIGIGLGVGYYFLIEKAIQRQRQSAVNDIEQLLRKMRLKGMDESLVQTFVAKYSGKNWEELFESLFGYAAKRRCRDELAKSDIGKKRPKFWAWRDRINDSLDSRLEPLITQKEKQHLQKIEQAGLQAEGVSATEAQDRAAQMAEAMVDHGDSIRVAALQQRIADLDPDAQRLKQRLKVKAMLAEARSGQYRKKLSPLEKITPMLNRTIGSYTRFLLGCLLIVGCLMWARQNGFFEVIKETAAKAENVINAVGVEGAKAEAEQQLALLGQTMNRPTEPLSIPILGGMFFWNFNALIAGLILLCSSVVFGWRMSIFAIPAALIAVWGSAFGIPDIQPIKAVHALSAMIAVGVFTVGIVFGRMED